ncbi:MAG: oxygen-binding di-iron domain-containing protein [Polyangia bacterium]
MSVTNSQYGTHVDEVADGIYRISTPVADVPGGFSFNQYLVRDAEPLLFHTGPRRMGALVAEAIASVLPVATLRYVGFSHFENDECGGLNALLAQAPDAQPLCGKVNAMINGDAFDRPPRALADGEELAIGSHRLRWLDAPHLPHAWECGYLVEERTRTLLCGDLFTQPGTGETALTSGDILGPSEAFRGVMDYYSHTRNVRALVARLAATAPTTLACMHGSAWQGDGATLLGALGDALDGRERR